MRIMFAGAALALLALTVFIGSTTANQMEGAMTEEFLKAVTQGEIEKVRAMLKTDPRLAQAKDSRGVSAILKA